MESTENKEKCLAANSKKLIKELNEIKEKNNILTNNIQALNQTMEQVLDEMELTFSKNQKYNQGKVFDITINRPKVLLFGNGLIYSEQTNWEKFILSVARDDAQKKIIRGVPYSLLSTVLSYADDSERWKKYYEFLNDEKNMNIKPMIFYKIF